MASYMRHGEDISEDVARLFAELDTDGEVKLPLGSTLVVLYDCRVHGLPKHQDFLYAEVAVCDKVVSAVLPRDVSGDYAEFEVSVCSALCR